MKHNCEGHSPHDGYGPAIDHCIKNKKGELWSGNGEYGSQVNYCPYCGYEAEIKTVYIPPGVEKSLD